MYSFLHEGFAAVQHQSDQYLDGRRRTAAKRVLFAAKEAGHKPARTALVLPEGSGRPKSLNLRAVRQGDRTHRFWRVGYGRGRAVLQND